MPTTITMGSIAAPIPPDGWPCASSGWRNNDWKFMTCLKSPNPGRGKKSHPGWDGLLTVFLNWLFEQFLANFASPAPPGASRLRGAYFEVCPQLCAESCQIPKLNSLADSPHDVKVKVEVVEGVQDRGQDLSGDKQVAQVSARISAADRAGAALIRRANVAGIARILDQQPSAAGKKAAVARVARGQDAIHHVNSALDVVGDVLGLAHAHQVTGFCRRQLRCGFGGHCAGDFVRLTHGQAADGVAGKIELDQTPRVFAAQLGQRPALHDSEEHLVRLVAVCRKVIARAPRPIERARSGLT